MDQQDRDAIADIYARTRHSIGSVVHPDGWFLLWLADYLSQDSCGFDRETWLARANVSYTDYMKNIEG